MSIYKILVCGGRDFNDYAFMEKRLNEFMNTYGKFAIISGGARGADSLAVAYGRANGLAVIEVQANWDFYGKPAGSIRNKWMLDLCNPSYAIAFPGGVGTAHMIKLLRAANVPVWEL